MRKFSSVAVILLGIFWTLSWTASRHESATFDEPANLVSGYVFWKTGKHQIDLYHPPLLRMWESLPLLGESLLLPPEPWTVADQQFSVGNNFVFRNRASPTRILQTGRFMALLLGVFLGWLLWYWATLAMGPPAALGTLVAYSFCPMLLAHSHYATTDIGITFLWVLTFFSLWRWVEHPDYRRATWVGVSMGLAAASKYSSVMLAATAIPVAVWAWRSGKKPVRFWLGCAALFSMAALVPLAACFRIYHWGPFFEGIHLFFHNAATGRTAYFMGENRAGGWKIYFLAAFLIKTPIPFLTFIGLGAWFWKSHPSLSFAAKWGLFPALLLGAIISFSPTQLGIRYMLPVYPLLCLWIGAAAAELWVGGKKMRILCQALGVWYIACALLTFPWYLSYYNEFAGGPSQGYRYLLDSNTDWGQGLIALNGYLHKEGIDQILLSYFGGSEPHAYGIDYVPVHCYTGFALEGTDRLRWRQQRKILLVVSATNKGEVYLRPNTFADLATLSPVALIADSLWVYDITPDFQRLVARHSPLFFDRQSHQ